MQHVILESSYGNNRSFEAAVENALQIFHFNLDEFNFKPVDISKKLFIKENILDTFKKILFGTVGEFVKDIEITEDKKIQIIVHCFQNKISLENKSIDSYSFFKSFSFEDFPFLQENERYRDYKDAELIDSYTHDIMYKYNIIINDKFKVDITPERKILYILEFVNSIVNSDIKYELIEFHTLYSD